MTTLIQSARRPATPRASFAKAAAILLGVAVGAGASVEVPTSTAGGAPTAPISIGMSSAQAGPVIVRPGVARRTTRRVVRRNVARAHYRASVVGCPYRAPYYYCSGYYYSPVIQDGKTVYVSVHKDVVVVD